MRVLSRGEIHSPWIRSNNMLEGSTPPPGALKWAIGLLVARIGTAACLILFATSYGGWRMVLAVLGFFSFTFILNVLEKTLTDEGVLPTFIESCTSNDENEGDTR